MTVDELLTDALKYEESFLSHAIYCGIRKGAISGSQQVTDTLYDLIDLEEAYKLHQQNVLGIQSVKLFTVPLGNKLFAMFFAETEQIARALYKKEFGKECERIHLVNYGLEISTYDPESKMHQTWRELRESLPVLPAYAGLFQK